MPLTRFKLSAIDDGGISTAKLADSSVTSQKIGVDVIVAEDIASNAITVAELADGAVTSSKLDTNIDIAGTLDVTGALTADSSVSVAGNVSVDTDTLFVDATNDQVGIGINSSINGKAHIYRPTTIGNIGESDGYDTSLAALTVEDQSFQMYIDGNSISSNVDGDFKIGTLLESEFSIVTNSSRRITVLGGGNVGINTETPTATLHVNGDLLTNDLILSNMDREEGPNEVDGTRGHWCIQEGEADLFIINRQTGKKYKFALEEIN